MSGRAVLAIDLGTSGPKVAIVDVDGNVLAWRSAPVETKLLDGGGAEQDAEQMWRAVTAATHAALGALGVRMEIAGIAVTSQYMSVVPIDGEGRPTGPSILWMDSRGAAHNLSLLTDESFLLFATRHGLIPLPSGNDNLAHVAVLREHHRRAFDDAAAFVEPMDYLTARLCGRITATQSTMFSFLVCDNRTWGATSYDSELVRAGQTVAERLPELVPLSGAVGELRADAAAELGLEAGIPVFPGTIDSITSAVGAGALDARRGAVVIGTTAVMVSHVPHAASDLGVGILDVPSPVPGQYFVMAENGLGGRAMEWARHLFGYGGDIELALHEAAAVAPGSEGVAFLPWMLGSLAPSPNDDVRGAFCGLSLHHHRAHAMRAVLEGVAANLGWLAPAVEAHVGGPFETMAFGGGGAQSELWGQILADALARPVHRLAEPRVTNARGAAFLALADLGERTLEESVAGLRVAHVHDPEPGSVDALARLRARMAELHPHLAAFAAH